MQNKMILTICCILLIALYTSGQDTFSASKSGSSKSRQTTKQENPETNRPDLSKNPSDDLTISQKLIELQKTLATERSSSPRKMELFTEITKLRAVIATKQLSEKEISEKIEKLASTINEFKEKQLEVNKLISQLKSLQNTKNILIDTMCEIDELCQYLSMGLIDLEQAKLKTAEIEQEIIKQTKQKREEEYKNSKEGKQAELIEAGKAGNLKALVTLHRQGNEEAFKKMKQMADDGDINAQHALGLIYFNGVRVSKSELFAEKYFTMAGNNNFTPAKKMLIELYLRKNGSLYNIKKAIKIMEELAYAGDQRLMILIARCADCGMQMEKDPSKAARLYRKLARKEYIPAMGYCAENGIEENVDFDKALKLYYDSGCNGNVDGAYLYVKLRLKLDPHASEDEKVQKMLTIGKKHPGINFLSCFLEQNFYLSFEESKHLQGMLYYAAQKLAKNENQEGYKIIDELEQDYQYISAYFVHLWRLIWGSGTISSNSQDRLKGIQMYLKYKDRISEVDPVILYRIYLDAQKQPISEIDSLEILKNAANQHYSVAALEYAKILIKDNPLEAVQYLAESAKQKNCEALYLYASCFENGNGVDKDLSRAFQLYQQCSQYSKYDEKFSSYSRLHLAHMYAAGSGCSKNLETADELYRLAINMIRTTLPRGGKDKEHSQKILIDTMRCANEKLPSALFMLGVFVSRYNSRDFPALVGYNHVSFDTPLVINTLKENGFPAPEKRTDEVVIKKVCELWGKAIKHGSPEAAYALGMYAKDKDLFEKAINLAKGKINAGSYVYLIDSAQRRMKENGHYTNQEYAHGLEVKLAQ